MALEILTGEALDLAVENAGKLPGIVRDRSGEPVDADILAVFGRISDGLHVAVASVDKSDAEAVKEATATVARWNRAAARDGQRAEGFVATLRTVDDRKVVHVGRDTDLVARLDAAAIRRAEAAAKAEAEAEAAE